MVIEENAMFQSIYRRRRQRTDAKYCRAGDKAVRTNKPENELYYGRMKDFHSLLTTGGGSLKPGAFLSLMNV